MSRKSFRRDPIGGPNVADSYYMCSKEENNSAFQLDVEQNMRMFRTGDIGRINLANNSLSIIDRQGFSFYEIF